MDKTGEVRPGVTPDVEGVLAGDKVAASPQVQAALLNDDLSKRLADRGAEQLRQQGCDRGTCGCRRLPT